jgi:hypothetical protein
MLKEKLIGLAITSIAATQIAYGATPDEIRKESPQPFEFHVPGDVLVAPVLEEPDVVVHTAGAHYYKQALTSTKPRITSSEKFVLLPGARTRVAVPAGADVLVNVAFTAESRCNEPGSTAPNWCEVRIMVDGAEAAPAASSFPTDTYAFDSTDRGTETSASWESHAMDRHRCFFNGNGNATKNVPIEVEWNVTNFDGGVAPRFWLDDWSLTVELAKGCRLTRLNVND